MIISVLQVKYKLKTGHSDEPASRQCIICNNVVRWSTYCEKIMAKTRY